MVVPITTRPARSGRVHQLPERAGQRQLIVVLRVAREGSSKTTYIGGTGYGDQKTSRQGRSTQSSQGEKIKMQKYTNRRQPVFATAPTGRKPPSPNSHPSGYQGMLAPNFRLDDLVYTKLIVQALNISRSTVFSCVNDLFPMQESTSSARCLSNII